MRLAAVAFHVDSLNEAYDFPPDYRDPSFHEVAGRFFAIADEFSFRATCFVIGRDLEKEDHRACVRHWSAEGHEIASHSHSHLYDFGALPEARIRSEIADAHAAITSAAGRSPRGFTAPNWSSSERHLAILKEFGYLYDASLFPSWLRFPAALKAFASCLSAGNGRGRSVLNQRHLAYALAGPRGARVVDSGGGPMALLPMPSNRYRVATWHTLAFMFGRRMHQRILSSCLADCEYFYYVVHPADLLDIGEVDRSRRTNLARLDVALSRKVDLLRRSIETILNSGRRVVPMQEVALAVMERHGATPPSSERPGDVAGGVA